MGNSLQLERRPLAVGAAPRLAVLCDFPEEGWPSMDLVAAMLLEQLRGGQHGEVRLARLCPPFRRRLTRVPVLKERGFAANADRFLNRFHDYPRYLRQRRADFDLFHVCDHSYAQLVHELPADRTGVHCHDLDAFRCLLDPKAERRPAWFHAMARRILDGLQKAAVVFHATAAVRRQIEHHGLVDPNRLVQAPLGISAVFTPEPREDVPDLPGVGPEPFLLHVGSCIPRKRVDVLLEVFAAVRRCHRELRLVQVGGQWTPPQRERIARLGIGQALTQVRGLASETLADLYRRAVLVLLPSEAEGFGLPVIEALACGTAVVASDLPVLREVGGEACVYCPVADVAAWAGTVARLVSQPHTAPSRATRLQRAGQFSWEHHARVTLEAYRRLR